MSALHDIDAVSMAVPYCHVVVPDREIADLLSRSRAGQRNGTQILTGLRELPNVVGALAVQVRSAARDATGWDWEGPGEGFCLDESELRTAQPPRGLNNSSVPGRGRGVCPQENGRDSRRLVPGSVL